MAKRQYINIDFPFQDSEQGFYFKLNAEDKAAIKSDLLHLLLTNKGERLYMPDFGSDLKKYIFEPNDNVTHDQIKENLNQTIKRYIPNLVINSIKMKKSDLEELIIAELTYTVKDSTFVSTDTIELIL